MSSSRALPPDRVASYRTYVIQLLAEARSPASSPRAALSATRSAAEAMTKHAYEAQGSDPGKLMLEDLIQKLGQQKVLPPRVATALRTVQAFGNLGAHAQSDLVAAAAEDVLPARAAIDIVASWYQADVLGARLDDAPGEPAPAPKVARSRRVAVFAGLAVVAAGAGTFALVSSRGGSTTKPPPAVSGHDDEPAPPTKVAAIPDAGPTLAVADAAAIRPSGAPPIVVDLTVWRDGVALAPKATLHSGDKVAFEVHASAPTYVYLIQRIGDDLDVLYAASADDGPRENVRIPDGDRYFALVDDGTYGATEVTVVASATPRDDLAATLATVSAQTGKVRRDAVAKAKAKVAALADPGAADGMVARGHFELVDEVDRPKVSIRFRQRPEDDLVVATFVYTHAR